MKKILMIVLTLALIASVAIGFAACGETDSPKKDTTPSTDKPVVDPEGGEEEPVIVFADPLDFLQKNQLRVDINVENENALKDLNVQVNGTAVESGKAVSFGDDLAFTIEGTYEGNLYIYYVFSDGEGNKSVHKSSNLDSERFPMLSERLTNSAKKMGKLYLVLTDKATDGWTKGLNASLDAELTSYEKPFSGSQE